MKDLCHKHASVITYLICIVTTTEKETMHISEPISKLTFTLHVQYIFIIFNTLIITYTNWSISSLTALLWAVVMSNL